MKAYHLVSVRKDAGLNQIEVSDLVGCNRETIIDIERGRIGIDEETEKAISDAIAANSKRVKEVSAS